MVKPYIILYYSVQIMRPSMCNLQLLFAFYRWLYNLQRRKYLIDEIMYDSRNFSNQPVSVIYFCIRFIYLSSNNALTSFPILVLFYNIWLTAPHILASRKCITFVIMVFKSWPSFAAHSCNSKIRYCFLCCLVLTLHALEEINVVIFICLCDYLRYKCIR